MNAKADRDVLPYAGMSQREISNMSPQEVVKAEKTIETQNRNRYNVLNDEVSLGESVKNSANNAWVQLKKNVPQLQLLSADIWENTLGKELANDWYKWEGRDIGEVRANAYQQLEDLDAELKQTKGNIADNLKYMNGSGLVANLADAVFNLGATALPAYATGGAATVTSMTGQSIADFNAAKALAKGKTIEQLYSDGEAEIGTPLLIGGIATGLEFVGLKGAERAVLGKLGSGSVAKRLGVLAFETNKEGLTEFMQTGLDEANKALAQGDSIGEASEKAVDKMFSKEGLNSYLMGTFGVLGAAGLGKVSRFVVKPKNIEAVNTNIAEIADMGQDLNNPNVSEVAKEVIVSQIAGKVEQVAEVVNSDIEETSKLSQEDKVRIDELSKQAESLNAVVNDANVSEASKVPAQAQLEEINKEIESIKPKKNAVEEVIEPQTTETNTDQKEALKSPTIAETMSGEGEYYRDGEKGVIKQDGQTLVFETNDRIYELGNVDEISNSTIEDFGIRKAAGLNINVTDDGTIEIDGKKFKNTNEIQEDAFNYDEDGNIQSITLENDKGQKRTIRGVRAEEIAYQYKLKSFENNATDEQISRAIEQADEAIRVEGETKPIKSEEKVRVVKKPREEVNEERISITPESINIQETATPKTEEAIATPREESIDVSRQIEEKIPQGNVNTPNESQPKGETKVNAEVVQLAGNDGGGNESQTKAIGTADQNVSGITQEATAKAREQMGIEAYEKTSQSNEQRRAKAEKAIKDGYNVKQLVTNIKSSEDFVPSRQEFEILKIYENSLTAAIQKNPTSEMIAERADLLRTIDVSTSRAGSSLQAIAGLEATEDNLANFLQAEAVHYGVDQLPQNIIDDLKSKYEKGQEAKRAYEEGYEKAKDEFIKQQAALELSRQRKRNKPSEKKSKADYASERAELKQSIKDKLKKARGQLNAVPIPYLNELVAIAPDVARLVRSYVEEGVSTLNDIVRKVHDDLKEDISGITEQDVIDLIAGQYNEKRVTKTEILSQVRDLREQAKLLKKIEDLENGNIPNDAVKQIRRNAELEKLRAQVKELEDEVGITEQRTLKQRRTALDNKIKQLQEDLELGNFDLDPIEPRKVRLDAETQKKQDEYIEFLKETNKRRDQAMYDQQSAVTKAWLKFQQVLGLRRLIQTSIDFSMPFRQAVTVTLNPRYVPTTLKSFANMFKSTFSEKAYDRMMFNIQQDPLYQDMRIDGLMFSEIDSKDNLKREEDFRTSFLYKIPYLREPFLASNRAAAGYINTARYNLYLKGVERLRAQGITHENGAENYEALAKWTMNMTGRGNLLSFMEKGENASKWQRIMGDTFYGTRLMASRFNMLNPNYYVKMPKAQRIEALKDIGAYVGLSGAVALGAIAAGATVSTDPEDADFLKAKWGNKRYDLFSGGMNTYLRTAYRLMKAIYMRTNPKLYGENKDATELKKANKYGSFAVKSSTDFFRYKLAPNTSYVLSGILGKDPLGKPFNPNDILAFYPMYVDDLKEAMKKDDAFLESTAILAPSLFGIGVQEYDNKKKAPTKEKE